MPDANLASNLSDSRRRALARWDNEGGAIAATKIDALGESPLMTNTELVQLRIRVIALENLMIAVLAEGPDRQREIAREMAGHIAPRPGHTQHPLTVQAAHHMTDLVDRALHFGSQEPRAVLTR